MTFACPRRGPPLHRYVHALGWLLRGAALSLVLTAGDAMAAERVKAEFAFPKPLSPDLPYDVDGASLRRFVDGGDIAAGQRLFDIFSWQSFLALNWPAQADGAPDKSKNLSDSRSRRVWETYRESSTVFLPEGAAPEPWNPSPPAAARGEPGPRKLWMTAIGDRNATQLQRLDESFQAFSGPLVDLNGNWVRYEVLMNQTEFDYIHQNELFNLDGQALYTATHPIQFPANQGKRRHGSMELKMAWKQLGPNDDESRFLVRKASVVHYEAGPDGVVKPGNPTLETMGLVGMHLAVRTESAPTWVWATFEHVDNVNANELERDARGRPLHPNFYNPNTPTVPVNTLPPPNARTAAGAGLTTWAENLTRQPTQVLQVTPVPRITEALNEQVQELLRQQGSVFQHYRLIGTQWPVQPSFPAFPGGMVFGTQQSSAPESIVYKTPGKVVPVYLVNTTMETYFQKGNQAAGPLAEDDRLPAGQESDPQTVFGTESCAGCHYSAGACIGFKTDLYGKPMLDANGNRIPIFGKNANQGMTGNANYSWLLQMRAQPKSKRTPQRVPTAHR
jgi:hypothetical protein